MVTVNPGQPKVGLNRRHNSMFSAEQPSTSSPATHTKHRPQGHPDQPRRYPTDQSSPHQHANGQNTTPRQGPPYPSAMRHPTPVVEELPDEPTQPPQPRVTTYYPPQHAQQGPRFSSTGYNRNLPPGQQAPPSRSATSGPPGQFRQGGPPPFSTQGTHRLPQAVPRGVASAQRPQGMRVDDEEAMLAKEFQARMKQGSAHSGSHPSGSGRNGPPPQGHPQNRQTGPHPPVRGPAHQGQLPHPSSRPVNRTVNSKTNTDAEAVLFDDDDEGRKRKGATDEDDDFSDIDEGRKTGHEQALVKRGAVEESRVIIKEKAGPIQHFNAPLQLNSPFAVAHLLDSIAIRKTRYDLAQVGYKTRQEEADEEKKHIQWNVVSDVFEVQQQNLEKAMGQYNSVISRFNDLADIKNRSLQEKEDLTDRYRRAGATLSTQCVTLQTSTHQVRLPEVKKRRLITDGRSGSGMPGAE